MLTLQTIFDRTVQHLCKQGRRAYRLHRNAVDRDGLQPHDAPTLWRERWCSMSMTADSSPDASISTLANRVLLPSAVPADVTRMLRECEVAMFDLDTGEWTALIRGGRSRVLGKVGT